MSQHLTRQMVQVPVSSTSPTSAGLFSRRDCYSAPSAPGSTSVSLRPGGTRSTTHELRNRMTAHCAECHHFPHKSKTLLFDQRHSALGYYSYPPCILTTMKVQSVLATLALCMLASFPVMQAYYFGAGGCAGGTAAVGPPHFKNVYPTFNTQVMSGTLAQGGFQVILDSSVLTAGGTTGALAGKSHVISVKGGTGKVFKGFMIRLGIANANALLPISGSRFSQPNSYCTSTGAVGITHTNNITKSGISGTVLVSNVQKIPLDVTIVVQNRQKKSIFYYTRYYLNFHK